MSLDDPVGVGQSITDIDSPPHERLAGVLAPRIHAVESKANAEIPRSGDPIVQRDVLEVGAEHEVRRCLESEETPDKRLAFSRADRLVLRRAALARAISNATNSHSSRSSAGHRPGRARRSRWRPLRSRSSTDSGRSVIPT